jgi:hypothetical protein
VLVPPAESVPVAPPDEFVKLPTTIVSAPAPTVLVRVTDEGIDIENVELALPVTLKEAAETVPGALAGRVKPDAERTPAAVIVTVPPLALLAIFPKFKSIVLVIAIGVMIVAVAVATSFTCPNELTANPTRAIKRIPNFFMIFFLNDFFLIFLF